MHYIYIHVLHIHVFRPAQDVCGCGYVCGRGCGYIIYISTYTCFITEYYILYLYYINDYIMIKIFILKIVYLYGSIFIEMYKNSRKRSRKGIQCIAYRPF